MIEDRYADNEINPLVVWRAKDMDRKKRSSIEQLRKNQEAYVDFKMDKSLYKEQTDRFRKISRSVVDNVFTDLVPLYPFVQVMSTVGDIILINGQEVPVLAKMKKVCTIDTTSSNDDLLIEVISGKLKEIIDEIMDSGIIFAPYIAMACNPFLSFVEGSDKIGHVLTRYGAHKI